MRQSENKKRAEELSEAVIKQVEMIAKESQRPIVTAAKLQTLLGVADITAQLAQVHAALANIPDQPDHRGMGYV